MSYWCFIGVLLVCEHILALDSWLDMKLDLGLNCPSSAPRLPPRLPSHWLDSHVKRHYISHAKTFRCVMQNNPNLSIQYISIAYMTGLFAALFHSKTLIPGPYLKGP